MFANPIEIKSQYCASSDSLMLKDIVPNTDEDKILMGLPHSSRFQIPFIRIEALLQEHGLKAIDKTDSGLITIARHCASDLLLTPLEQKLRLEFKSRYKTLQIRHLNLSSQAPLPADFESYTFEKWRISESTFRRPKGSFSATYLNEDGMRKTFYFRFELDGNLQGFKAKHNLSNGTILSLEDLEATHFGLSEVNDIPLESFESNEWILKHYIRQGNIILLRHLEQKPLVARHDYVDALVRDGGLVITIRAQVLSDGKKGEIVRVRTSDGRMFNAIVMNNTKVLIKE
jgi:flagella basal body P-ring formation protein FlgA